MLKKGSVNRKGNLKRRLATDKYKKSNTNSKI